jgi:hypothetical protein
MKRLPRSLRRGTQDEIACCHRDLSVCPDCAKQYAPELVDVYGQHYWVPDPADREALAKSHEAFDSVEVQS